MASLCLLFGWLIFCFKAGQNKRIQTQLVYASLVIACSIMSHRDAWDTHLSCVSVSVSIPAQGGIFALGRAHTYSALSLSSVLKIAFETVPMFVWLNTDRLDLGRWNVGRFLSPLLFPSGDQCSDAPQACKHLCPVKLYTRCHVCLACQSICPFIPSVCSMARAVDQQKSLLP